MTRILLVRHGQTEWNSTRRLQGQQDIALSDSGRAQVALLRPLVLDPTPELTVSSPLARARDTALGLGLTIDRTDDRLMEAYLGTWEGVPVADLPPEEYATWRAGDLTPPDGESFGELRIRVAEALRELAAGGPERVAVFTHGGVVRAALAELVGVTPHQIVPASAASLTMLDATGGEWRLAAYNLRVGALEANPSE